MKFFAKFFAVGLATLIVISAFTSCSKKDNEKTIDEELFEMALKTEGFVWHQLSDELLDKSPGSGHTTPFLRTRYNNIASNYLDSEGKVIDGTIFPEGSLIVKELYDADETFVSYSILYKNAINENSDSEGWVWAIINADKSAEVSAETKGTGCIQCHSQTGNIDKTLMNKFFP